MDSEELIEWVIGRARFDRVSRHRLVLPVDCECKGKEDCSIEESATEVVELHEENLHPHVTQFKVGGLARREEAG